MTRAGDGESGDPVLAVEDLVVERAGERILDGVSLSVRPGERLLVRGRSGAGKTTLFEVLGLLDGPTGGSLRLDGRDAAALTERGRARLRRELVGVIFQEFELVPDLTVRENAALPQEHGGDRDDAWVDALLARLGLADLADAYPATLSGGEKQRTAIARALSNRPRVVLADEPTGQLDPETARAAVDLLFELGAEAGTALVVVSHDRSLGPRFDRVLRLVDGDLRPVE